MVNNNIEWHNDGSTRGHADSTVEECPHSRAIKTRRKMSTVIPIETCF